MEISKSAVTANKVAGKISSIFGYVVGIAMLLAIIFGSSSKSGADISAGLTFCWVMLVIAVLFILHGVIVKSRIRRFKKYIGLIADADTYSIAVLAGATGQKESFVKTDLQTMINKKFFTNAQIDAQSGQLIFGGLYSPPPPPSPPPEMQSVTCPSCGAPNMKPKGTDALCAYCKGPI